MDADEVARAGRARRRGTSGSARSAGSVPSRWSVFVAAAVGALLGAAGCQKSLRGAHCNCTSGWTCCETLNLCLLEGETCPRPDAATERDAPADIGTDLASGAADARDASVDLSADRAAVGEVAPPPSFPLVCTYRGWCWVHPRPTGEALVALSVQGDDDVWVAGQSGDVLRLQVSGGVDTWTSHELRSDDLAAMWGASSSDMWFGGIEGFWHWTTLGEPMFFPPDAPAHQRLVKTIWGSSADDVWVGGHGFKHFVKGVQVPVVRTDALLGDVVTLWGSGPKDVFAGLTGSQSEGILHWDGDAWSPSDDLGAGKLAGRGPGDVWASSIATVKHYGGDGWKVPDKAPPVPLAWASTSKAVGQLREDGLLWWWEGSDWSPVAGAKPAPAQFTVLSARSKTDVWGAGPRGALAHWDGATWTSKLPGPVLTTSTITHLAGVGMPELWAAAGGTLLRGQGGQDDRWQIEAGVGDVGGKIDGIWSPAAGDLWLLGSDDHVHRLAKGAWSVIDVTMKDPNAREATAVTGSGPKDVWILRGDRVHHRLNDTGWTPVTPLKQPITHIVSVGFDEAWFGGQGLVHYEGGAQTSARIPETSPVTALAAAGPEHVWAAFDAKLYGYDAGTDTWSSPLSFGASIVALAAGGAGDVWVVLNPGGRSQLRHIKNLKDTDLEPQVAPAALGTAYLAPDGSLWSGGDYGALLRYVAP